MLSFFTDWDSSELWVQLRAFKEEYNTDKQLFEALNLRAVQITAVI